MKPFDKYPDGGRKLFGIVKGANCRRGYCLEFMRKTTQTKCAYCGADFGSCYETWLTMALDHVVPTNLCDSLKIPDEWSEDCANKVLACAACNAFRNRYNPMKKIKKPKTIAEFINLRDMVFAERKIMIAQRHKEEKAFFKSRPWASK